MLGFFHEIDCLGDCLRASWSYLFISADFVVYLHLALGVFDLYHWFKVSYVVGVKDALKRVKQLRSLIWTQNPLKRRFIFVESVVIHVRVRSLVASGCI